MCKYSFDIFLSRSFANRNDTYSKYIDSTTRHITARRGTRRYLYNCYYYFGKRPLYDNVIVAHQTFQAKTNVRQGSQLVMIQQRCKFRVCSQSNLEGIFAVIRAETHAIIVIPWRCLLESNGQLSFKDQIRPKLTELYYAVAKLFHGANQVCV